MLGIQKKKKLGEGAYGVVYEAEIEEDGMKKKVAVKRNYGDNENQGIACIRELSFLASLNHPCITKLKSVSIGDPFPKECPMTPRPQRNEMKEDTHHFILEFSNHCLEDYYIDCDDYYEIKIIMAQILLGIEYLHHKKILHRDLKPGNILVSKEKNLPYAKICDFGLSCFPSNYRPSTPGAVTSWYRAPEICCEYENYSFPSDMWSVGCIFFEIVTGVPFIKTDKDNSKRIFRDIVSILPEKFKTKDVTNFIKGGDCDRFKHGYTEKLAPRKKSFIQHMNEHVDIKNFEKSEGSIQDFCDLLDNILVLNPEKRFTATQCLNHPFFNKFQKYISEMRKKYPLEDFSKEKLVIYDTLERRWACNIFIKIYNKRDDLDWYTDHLLFHSLRIYDEYLKYMIENKDIEKRPKAEKGIGKILTEEENSINVYTCVYMVYKYFCTLYKLFTWEEIFPKYLVVNSNIKKIEDFEKFILEKICKYSIFKPTVLEYLNEEYKEKCDKSKMLDIRTYFLNYCNINRDYLGTTEDLYKQIKNFQDSE